LQLLLIKKISLAIIARVFLIGTPAMTSRGLVEKDFNKGLVKNKDIEALKADVEKFSASFDMPGFLTSEMKYKD
jgi:glycine hydroxymethyltransferase